MALSAVTARLGLGTGRRSGTHAGPRGGRPDRRREEPGAIAVLEEIFADQERPLVGAGAQSSER